MVLAVVFVSLRQLLGLGTNAPPGRVSLDANRERLCLAIALELESRAAILAVSLNDAVDEMVSGNAENAWKLLHLTVSEWNRLAEILSLLLRVIANYLPLARVATPARSLVPRYFRSEIMIEYVRLHDWVDQFLFRAKLRFSLQVRILRHGVDSLTADFRRVQPRTYMAPDSSPALWTRLDCDFHDFDLIIKGTLLAFRSFVTWLPESAVRDFTTELQPVLEHSVRASAWTVPQ
ncbi:MAG TPA: hypothetical protein VI455_18210 [Terriglobia bacterium]